MRMWFSLTFGVERVFLVCVRARSKFFWSILSGELLVLILNVFLNVVRILLFCFVVL